MRIVWVTTPTEMEADLWRAAQGKADLIQVSVTGAGEPYFQYGAQGHEVSDLRDLLYRVAGENADLIVFRYPTWVHEFGLSSEVEVLFRDQPVVAWLSEQGPTIGDALAVAGHWPRVAVNNRLDVRRFRHWLPATRLYYLPFGCVRWAADELIPQERFRNDLIADGAPHYACWEHGGWKRESVRVMVDPVLDLNIGLWGATGEKHGWPGVPGAVEKFRGAYAPIEAPQVYASCKVYLGISWSWALGGYGMKLARALSSGIAVIWHRTPGMLEDGLQEGVHLLASSTPQETLHAARWLLDDEEMRRLLGETGKAFVLRHWEWITNLERLAAEIGHDG